MTPLLLTVVALTAIFAGSTVAVIILIRKAPLIEDGFDRFSSEQVTGIPGAVSSRAKSPPRLRGRAASGPVFYVPHAGQHGAGGQARMPR
jgi:hypothetical protein